MRESGSRGLVLVPAAFLIAALGMVFVPRWVYDALWESEVESHSENALTRYAEQAGRLLHDDPAGDSRRGARGARVLRYERPARDSLVVSTAVTVEAGMFFCTSMAVRCYDVSFTGAGTSGRRPTLKKVPGCDQESQGPAIPGPS
ncbi:hypothetical protein [Sphaerisporangium dianthi]|uniref:Uncharacterized protein n=1 Tax=Sphaerisporangium dianthi TaxID=1436120 RepID=A0ABV9CM54_9ACTN